MTAGPDARRRPARTGRRPGNPDTRQAILDAARATFAESGFDGASIRRIAWNACRSCSEKDAPESTEVMAI